MIKFYYLLFLCVPFCTYSMDNKKRKRDSLLMEEETDAKRVKVNNPTSHKAMKGLRKRKRKNRSQESDSKRIKFNSQHTKRCIMVRNARAKYFSERYIRYIFYYPKKGSL